MKTTLLSILLSSTLRSDINGFFIDYGIPIVLASIVMGVVYGLIQNLDLITDEKGNGDRKKGLIAVAWIVLYVIVIEAVLSGILLLLNNLKMSI